MKNKNKMEFFCTCNLAACQIYHVLLFVFSIRNLSWIQSTGIPGSIPLACPRLYLNMIKLYQKNAHSLPIAGRRFENVLLSKI